MLKAMEMVALLRYELTMSLRRLRRGGGTTAAAVAIFAMSIGAAMTAFSLFDYVWLRSLPLRHADRLVAFSATDSRTAQPGLIYSDAVSAFASTQSAFARLSMYHSGVIRLDTTAISVDIGVEGVTSGYFDVIGARPAAGRLFVAADDAVPDTAAPPVVISERLWHRAFAAQADAIGQSVQLDAHRFAVVGVVDDFVGLQRDGGVDVFVPLAAMRALSGDVRRVNTRGANVVALLADGSSVDGARTEVLGRWPSIVDATMMSVPPTEREAVRAQRLTVESIWSGFSGIRRQWGRQIAVLLTLAVIVLAVGTVNVAALVLAAGEARRHEHAIRLACGASRWRTFLASFIDIGLLAAAGFGLAIPLAHSVGIRLTEMLSYARAIPLQEQMTPDARVILATFGIAIATGASIGWITGWRATRSGAQNLATGARTIANDLGRTGDLMLVLQVALALVLVVTAALFTATLANLHRHDAAFRDRPIVWTRLARNPAERRTPLGAAYFEDLVQRLSTVRGASAAAMSAVFPGFLGFVGTLPIASFGNPNAPDDAVAARGLTDTVSPGFFDVFGIARIHGRDFTWHDDSEAPAVAIVNEALAAAVFGTSDAVGKRIRVSSGSPRVSLEIIGVVRNAPFGQLRQPHVPVLFRPLSQDVARLQSPMAHVLVAGDVERVKREYAATVESQRQHFIRGIFVLSEWIDSAVLQERLIFNVAMAGAAISVLLACVGIYSSLAFTVSARRREIGVRLAVGAARSTVMRLVVRDTIRVCLAGVVFGIPCAIATARLMRAELYGVAPDDPATIAAAAALLMATGFAAAAWPALRASQTDPGHALRHD